MILTRPLLPPPQPIGWKGWNDDDAAIPFVKIRLKRSSNHRNEGLAGRPILEGLADPICRGPTATYEEESRGGAVNIVAGVKVVVRKV